MMPASMKPAPAARIVASICADGLRRDGVAVDVDGVGAGALHRGGDGLGEGPRLRGDEDGEEEVDLADEGVEVGGVDEAGLLRRAGV